MNEKILIVDDDEHILKTCQRLLRKEPYQCITYSSPQEALEHAESINPVIIISDQRMPQMEGVEFLERIKGKLPWAIRILMTGYADIDAVINAINLGQVYRFIRKPWDDELFISEIRQAVACFNMAERLRRLSEDDESKKRIKQERLQGVLEMASAVCHEFAQPLQVISGHCELLGEMQDNPIDIHSIKNQIASIHRQADRLNDLLLKVGTIQEYKTKEYISGGRIMDIHKASSVDDLFIGNFKGKTNEIEN